MLVLMGHSKGGLSRGAQVALGIIVTRKKNLFVP